MANPFSKIRTLTVNNTTAGDQQGQIVQTSSTGDVMVYWLQGDGTSRIQIYDADGNEVSPEISIVNFRPPIWLDDGNFAVLDRSGVNTTITEYSRTGTVVTTSPNLSLPVSSFDQLIQLDNGNFVVTVTTITNSNHVTTTGQLLDPSFQLVGTSFPIGENTGDHFYRVIALDGGGFISYLPNVHADTTAQLFANDGTMVGDPIDSVGEFAAAAALPDGGFVLTGHRLFADGSSYGIVTRIFNGDGTLRTPEFIANTVTGGEQDYSNVAVVDDDLFVITWGPFNERGQLFDMDGRKIGGEFALETAGGFDGWRYGLYGWSIDGAHSDSGFVSSSSAFDDINLTYWGVDRANVLLGDGAANSFDGGGAAERIMVGYAGDDTYDVDSAGDEVQEIAGEGNDTILAGVSFVLGAGNDVETLATDSDAGTTAINLTGNALAQTIRGNAGANWLTGGGGGDTLIGLGGNDLYSVGNAADVVQEAASGGNDRIFAAVSYVLAAGVSVETMSTNLNTGTASLNLTGNELVQAIFGNDGINQLNGGGGADTLVGFGGNDSYVIVDGHESVVEAANGGTDRVFAAVDHVLRAGSSVETLSTDLDAGTAPIHLTGNELVQTIRGNAGANWLTGGGGGDIMIGLGGNDFYFVGDPRDVVTEAAAGGADRVFASTSYTLGAGQEVETLSTSNNAGTDAINLTGNALVQTIFGNAGANQLNGGGGADNLLGMGGNDFYYIVSGTEQVFESAGGGADRVFANVDYHLRAGSEVEVISTGLNGGTAAIDLTGNELAQTIFGNAGNNILDGGAGKDVLLGNGGADLFLFSTALNTAPGTAFAALGASANVDRIDGMAFDDKIGLDHTRFGLTPGALPADAFVTGTAAQDANDRIIYDQATGALLFDADGTGAQAAQLFAYINGPFSLDSTFFVVV